RTEGVTLVRERPGDVERVRPTAAPGVGKASPEVGNEWPREPHDERGVDRGDHDATGSRSHPHLTATISHANGSFRHCPRVDGTARPDSSGGAVEPGAGSGRSDREPAP